MMSHWRIVVLGAAVVGLIARLAFGLFYWVDKPLTQDELEYLMLARNLASGHGFTYDATAPQSVGILPQRFGRAPGYPAFLAAVSLIAQLPANPQSTPTSVKVAQAIVGALAIILIGALAERVAGPASGAIAALIASVYPPLAWICAYALSEAVYSVLALLTVLTLWIAMDRSGVRATTTGAGGVALAGGVAGLAALTRPSMVCFLGLCAAWLAVRRRPWQAATFIVGAAAVLAPWTIRNARESGRFVLIAPQGGVNFWIGNHRLAQGEGDLAANPLLKTADIELRRQHPGLDALELEPIYYREAFTQIAAHPVRWIGLLARKFVYQWIPIGPSYRLHSGRYYGASLVSYGLLLPFAIVGLVRLRRRGQVPALLMLMAGSEVLLALIFFPQERYRIPVIDPALIICAAASISSKTPSGRRASAS